MPDTAILVAVVLFVAIWNASVGPSGALTFAVMASLLPPFAVVPIHAVIEAVSALIRTAFLRDYVDWLFAAFFLSGALFGFLAGGPVFYGLAISDAVLQLALGCTILFVTWVRLPFFSGQFWKLASALGGLGTSFVTIFVGATSPLVTALVQQRHPDHRMTLGTSAVCMTLQHSGKIIVFGLIGFSFSQYADLIAYLIFASLCGTWIGRKFLFKIPQETIKPVFKLVVTALALHLIWQGVVAS